MSASRTGGDHRLLQAPLIEGCETVRRVVRKARRGAQRRVRRIAIDEIAFAHFGKGAIEGVAGPEAANNASAAGTLVPLLTLGLPTSATAAIMLAGFQQFGLQPGPLLFTSNATLVWGLIAACWWRT